jgi:polyhydroxybutyrate depolymerase
VVAFACVLGAGLCAGSARADLQTRTVPVGDTTRTYLLFLPGKAGTFREALPLVVMLHGGGGTAEQMVRFTRYNEIAARERFAVAYPQGLTRRWNDGRIFRGRGETSGDDVGFIRAVIADIDAKVVRLDRRRLYATGISNGGFMSFRLACEAADLFAAVAAVTATMPDDLGPRCKPAAPVSVLVINGTADPLVPYAGGHVRTMFGMRGAIWSTPRTVEFWAEHNRCGAPPVVRALPNHNIGDGSHVIEADYRGCAGGRVRLLRIEGGGHTWPGGIQYLPASWIGPTNRDLDASETIWSFFKSAPAR